MIKKNILSLAVAVLIAILSLSNSKRIDDLSPFYFEGIDKFVHFIMYFVLMSVMIFENRSAERKKILFISIIPFLYGLIIELLQSLLTTSRSGSVYDLLFNTAGIIFSLFLYLLLGKYFKNFRN